MPSGAVLLSRLLLDHEEYSTPLLQPLYIAFLTFFKIILAPLFYIRTLIPGTLLAILFAGTILAIFTQLFAGTILA